MKLQACFQLKAKYIAKICCKTAKYIFAKWKKIFSASLYSRTRTTSKTVRHIMEDNFALRYVLKHPGVNSRAELVPRRRLGDNKYTYRVGESGIGHTEGGWKFPERSEVSSENFQPPEVRPIPDSPNLQVWLVFIPYRHRAIHILV
jgi:hypothetical protein